MLCYIMLPFLLAGTVRRATLCRATFSPMEVRAISIFYQFIQFLGAMATATANDGEGTFAFISSFHLFADLAKHPQADSVASRLSVPPACPARCSSSLAHLRLPWRPSRVGWTHRKTKTKNVLSCFVSFTDE